MKASQVSRLWPQITAIVVLVFITTVPGASAFETIQLSTGDHGVLTWYYFNELGYTTDSANQCGTNVSPCFSYQLNTDLIVGNVANFYQGVMIVTPSTWWWEAFIGCPTSGSCSYAASSASYYSPSMLNSSNNVFVMAIDAGSNSLSWGVTSCNNQFTEPAYSFEFFVLSMSACTVSDSSTITPGSSYFTGYTFPYIQSVPVGVGGGSSATFEQTQITGELFNHNLGSYSAYQYTLTGETSNIALSTGSLGSVVPLCYHSPDVSAPC